MTAATTEETVTTSAGDGDWHVEVGLIKNITWSDREDAEPVCVLNKASYDLRTDGNVPIMRFYTMLADVTDFEHDTSKFALVEVALPYTLRDYRGCRAIIGVLSDLRLYPAGADPLAQSDGDTNSGWCEIAYGLNHTPHRFAPYLPPMRDETRRLLGRAVRVELSLQKDEDET